jgi:hypothetical protein
MKTIIASIICLVGAGCARFSTTQTDTSYDNTQKPIRTITTKVTATTFFTSKSDLSKFSATNTDKTQTTKVGALGQESSDPKFIEAMGSGIGTALKVYTGKP